MTVVTFVVERLLTKLVTLVRSAPVIVRPPDKLRNALLIIDNESPMHCSSEIGIPFKVIDDICFIYLSDKTFLPK